MVLKSGVVALSTRVSLWQARDTAKEDIYSKAAPHTMVSGIRTDNKDTEFRNGYLVGYMKVNTLTTCVMDAVLTRIQMVTTMLASGVMMSNMDKAFKLG